MNPIIRETNPTTEFQSLDNESSRKSKHWKMLLLTVFAMILPAGGLFAELPAQESKWPLMPVLVGDQRVGQYAERLAEGSELSSRNAERTLERMLWGGTRRRENEDVSEEDWGGNLSQGARALPPAKRLERYLECKRQAQGSPTRWRMVCPLIAGGDACGPGGTKSFSCPWHPRSPVAVERDPPGRRGILEGERPREPRK